MTKTSRRQFLAAASAIALTPVDASATLRKFLYRSNSGPPPSPPFSLISPASSWNGTAGSGFSNNGGSGVAIPVQGARTTASPVPAIKCYNAPDQRFSNNFNIGCITNAFNDSLGTYGVASVDIFCEGTVVNVTQTALNNELDPYGNPKRLPGHWATLKAADFINNAAFIAAKGVNGWGAVNVYFRSNPVNVALQPAVIGPIQFWVSALSSDVSVTVGPTTGQYPSIKAAAVATGFPFQHVGITIVDGGTYEMEDQAPGFIANSRATLTIATGITVRLQRSAAPTTIDKGLGAWHPGWNKFQIIAGDGLSGRPGVCQIDYTNICSIQGDDNLGGVRLYGVHGEVYAGANATKWATWGGGGFAQLGQPPAYLGYLEFCSFVGIGQVLAIINSGICNKVYGTAGIACDLTYFLAYNRVDYMPFPTEFALQASHSVKYTPSGGDTSATVRRDGDNYILSKNGSDIDTFVISGTPGDTNAYAANLITWINSHAGWTATGFATTDCLGMQTSMFAPAFGQASQLNNSYAYNPWPFNNGNLSGNVLDVFNKTGVFGTSFPTGYHSDVWRASDTTPVSDIVHLGNNFTNIGFSNPYFDNAVPNLDQWMADNAFHSAGLPGVTDGSGYQSGEISNGDHCVTVGNAQWTFTESASLMYAKPPGNGTAFASVANHAGPLANFNWTSTFSSGEFPITPNGIHNSYIEYRTAPGTLTGLPTTGINTGNTSEVVSGGPDTRTPLFTDPANGNWIPTSALKAVAAVTAWPWDMYRQSRAVTSECAGPVSKNTTVVPTNVFPYV